ncbi:purine-nucleoside phosphorylase [Rubeoparvulum massiliense]|uniref:purine-nucleoside phosphorylase n=1 Tax=Rubeoparvulum massiliense TaxID=1631346 RepID=UPI00065E51EE|nr:purine-nucleoside phosphorylase [Rubeoparvulum massiliense]
MWDKIKEATVYIQNHVQTRPTIGLVLGSGLGVLADEVENPTIIPYQEIPHFPRSTVEGHAGQLVIGQLANKQVICMQGRFHYYEGYPLQDVTFPIRVMKELGVETIILTNAAGGVNEAFEPGDLMLIRDHLNLAGVNPLIGANLAEQGVRFPDMSQAYDLELRNLAKEVASKQGITLQEGVYSWFTGPTYETPSEVKMARILGGDAAGMSTVPEVIVARHAGMRVLGISCITNMAAGILPQPLSHAEVMETAAKVQSKFLTLIKALVEAIK